MCLLKEINPEDIPLFIHRDLKKLSPVLFEHVDVKRLLKELVKIRLGAVDMWLIEQLSSTKIGYHIDGICVNNICYADDMVLLSPSIGALLKTFAKAHGLSLFTRAVCECATGRGHTTICVSQYNKVFRVLMGLPSFFSASGMFAEAQTDNFHVIIRKRGAFTMKRLRNNPSDILRLAERWDCPMLER
ncbi:hypothetical protein EVAR_5733_1 [Eumeta japonica]|uniref:Reverse transcriptase domain-containing protein n=1 Tax=Eumeta variegata TaxID=151549 RepID=A0A4C1T4F2_EUMVA|nr:hypothetical protein EVAR_5733_1 [Eumeta japonica]